jgi:transposase
LVVLGTVAEDYEPDLNSIKVAQPGGGGNAVFSNAFPDFPEQLQAALQQGLRSAARAFGCSRNTVRTWLRRYLAHGKAGLKERSRAPKRIPHKTPAEVEQRVLEARDRIPCFGPQRLKQEFDLPCSTGAIGRILRQAGRSRQRKKPRPPSRSLAPQKMAWPAFGLLQIDVQDLSDLPGYRELIPFGLPRYQYTARIVPEGALWLAFSAVNDSTYALLFADRLLAQFRRAGVHLAQLVVQTDNGSEFGGNWNRRHGLPPFTQLVEQKYRCRAHRFNPRTAPPTTATWKRSTASWSRSSTSWNGFGDQSVSS